MNLVVVLQGVDWAESYVFVKKMIRQKKIIQYTMVRNFICNL